MVSCVCVLDFRLVAHFCGVYLVGACHILLAVAGLVLFGLLAVWFGLVFRG